jgi:hypothetical protein
MTFIFRRVSLDIDAFEFFIFKISTRVFSFPFGRFILYLIWPDSPDPGLSNNGRAKFVALGLRGRQDGKDTRFGLLRPG